MDLKEFRKIESGHKWHSVLSILKMGRLIQSSDIQYSDSGELLEESLPDIQISAREVLEKSCLEYAAEIFQCVYLHDKNEHRLKHEKYSRYFCLFCINKARDIAGYAINTIEINPKEIQKILDNPRFTTEEHEIKIKKAEIEYLKAKVNYYGIYGFFEHSVLALLNLSEILGKKEETKESTKKEFERMLDCYESGIEYTI